MGTIRSLASRSGKWQEVDLEAGTVQVRRTLTKSGGRLLLGSPNQDREGPTQDQAHRKGDGGPQSPPQAAAGGERLQKAALWRDQGLVFASVSGTLINPTNLRKRSFASLLERAGVPEIRIHDLRHTCATLLLGRGVHAKFFQKLLGHANISITLDTYSTLR